MFNRCAQRGKIRPRRKIVRIDHKRRVYIGGGNLDAAAALRPDEPKPYRKSLLRLELGNPHHSSAAQGMFIWCRGCLRASKEKLALGPGCGCHRCLRFSGESRDEWMILKVLANSGQIAHRGNPIAAKFFSIADARKHEQPG